MQRLQCHDKLVRANSVQLAPLLFRMQENEFHRRISVATFDLQSPQKALHVEQETGLIRWSAQQIGSSCSLKSLESVWIVIARTVSNDF